MDTTEHTELGDALRFPGWDTLEGNPYITIDETGILHLDLQGINDAALPEQIGLRVSSGVIIAMSGDYFGGSEVSFDWPSIAKFKANLRAYDSSSTYETIGQYLIKKPITPSEEQKLLSSYQKLANKNVQQSEINTIYAINNAKYIPFSSTLNFYVQQLMCALKVKNYSEILNRNLAHFAPWSVRVYAIGHHIALKYARIHYELKQFVANQNYQSKNSEFNTLIATLKQMPEGLRVSNMKDLAYRYQALALGMEFFHFHYYTDHYAAGHISFVGDLRALLPNRFGLLGSLLVNNLHDELNRITVYTKQIYNSASDKNTAPIEAGGDEDFDAKNNYFNKQACLAGMTNSLSDLHHVFNGGELPEQNQYAGLQQLPDIDDKYRQPQPLLLLAQDNKIYYRSNLKEINILSPSQLQETCNDPLNHGYKELSSKFDAFFLIFKLRVLSFIYTSQLKTPTAEQLQLIEKEESELNPSRKPIPQPPIAAKQKLISMPVWQKAADDGVTMQSLIKNGLLSSSEKEVGQLQQEITGTKPTLSSPIA